MMQWLQTNLPLTCMYALPALLPQTEDHPSTLLPPRPQLENWGCRCWLLCGPGVGGTLPVALILQRKPDGFTHAEPFPDLAKVPEYFSSFSPSVNGMINVPGVKVTHTQSYVRWAGREEERSQGHGTEGIRLREGVQAWLWGFAGRKSAQRPGPVVLTVARVAALITQAAHGADPVQLEAEAALGQTLLLPPLHLRWGCSCSRRGPRPGLGVHAQVPKQSRPVVLEIGAAAPGVLSPSLDRRPQPGARPPPRRAEFAGPFKERTSRSGRTRRGSAGDRGAADGPGAES